MKKEYLLIAGALIAGWFFLGGSSGMPSFGGSSDRGGRSSGFEQSREPTCCKFSKEPDDYSDARSQSQRYSNRFSGRNR